MSSSAKKLDGMKLEGGWTIVNPVPVAANSTGGNFSVCYVVRSSDGKKAFLKALDLSRAFREPDPVRALQGLTEAFNFERDILNRCKDRHLDRVVTAIGDGTVRFQGASDGGVVPYLIFELADGDVRSQADISKRFDLAWSIRALHHIATGLWQLHGIDIAHQDVKPSNILVFDKRISKLADLGRAAYKGHAPPHEKYDIAGDPAYAPPELLYHQLDPDWNRRRFGCDAYLLGSMIVFLFTGAAATFLLRNELRDEHSWGKWSGSYEDVLPYVREAFCRMVNIVTPSIDLKIREDLIVAVRELCEPDPRLRGHPLNRLNSADQYSLERYVSKLDLMAQRAERGMFER